MTHFDNVYELAAHFQELTLGVEWPSHPVKPNREDYPNNASYGAAVDEWEPRKIEYLKARKEYNNALGEINNKFRIALFDFLGIADHPKAQKLWDMAWSRGHGSGYTEVAQIAEELSELL